MDNGDDRQPLLGDQQNLNIQHDDPMIQDAGNIDPQDQHGDVQIIGEPVEGEVIQKGGCKGRCDRCCGKCWNQCKRDCSTQGIFITLVHILIFLGSLMIAVVATVNKQKNFGMCLLEAIFNQDSGGYSFERTTGVMCDYTLYYGLCSSALAFLFIMVNWVAGLHKAKRWLQIQIVLNILGLLGKLVAGAMQTVGFFIWCDHLLMATNCPSKDPTCHQYPGRDCYNSSRIYDKNRGDEDRMQKFFIMVLTTMVGNWFTFLLWLVSTIAVAIKLVQHPEDKNTDEDDDDDDDDNEPEDRGGELPPENYQFGQGLQGERDLRQRLQATVDHNDGVNGDAACIRPNIPNGL